jgi:micrococcal nuclease
MAVAILFAILIAIRIWQDRQNPPTPETLAEGAYEVERVVDGDTLLLANGARVRLIGADAPETVKPESPIEPFGPEAAELSRRFIAEAGNVVQLQFDRERIDRYGRFLAYVWVGDRMLNEELIRAGLATAETRFRYAEAMKTRFRRAEDEAKAAGRGIWSREPARGAAGFPGTARFALFASPGRPRRLATTG